MYIENAPLQCFQQKSTGFNDSFEEFANKVQFDGTLADDDYDPKDFEWSSDEKESDKENLSEEEAKPAKSRKPEKPRGNE